MISVNGSALQSNSAQLDDDHRSLPRILARVLYVKEQEEEGLEEIDKLVKSIVKVVWLRNFIFWSVFSAFSAILLVVAIIGLSLILINFHPFFQIFSILFATILWVAPVVIWRKYQYGAFDISQKMQAGLYPAPSNINVEKMDKLFKILSERTKVKTYKYTWRGKKIPVDRQIYMGRLRGLLLSDRPADRSYILPPKGLWFSSVVYVDKEPEEIIELLDVKPERKKRNTTYDYKEILLALIEHPALKDIRPGVYRHETKLMALIMEACDAKSEHESDIAVPEQTELRRFAKRILVAIGKNRAVHQIAGPA